jgi:hypothetical protein
MKYGLSEHEYNCVEQLHFMFVARCCFMQHVSGYIRRRRGHGCFNIPMPFMWPGADSKISREDGMTCRRIKTAMAAGAKQSGTNKNIILCPFKGRCPNKLSESMNTEIIIGISCYI